MVISIGINTIVKDFLMQILPTGSSLSCRFRELTIERLYIKIFIFL